jgi:ElaB/YqjD/DUF883 family membrane-anchored ribosome-binding protein
MSAIKYAVSGRSTLPARNMTIKDRGWYIFTFPLTKTVKGAKMTYNVVHGRSYQAMSIAFGVGALIGMILRSYDF